MPRFLNVILGASFFFLGLVLAEGSKRLARATLKSGRVFFEELGQLPSEFFEGCRKWILKNLYPEENDRFRKLNYFMYWILGLFYMLFGMLMLLGRLPLST